MVQLDLEVTLQKPSQILALAITKRSQHNELVQFAKL
jgi:hypothetical protein